MTASSASCQSGLGEETFSRSVSICAAVKELTVGTVLTKVRNKGDVRGLCGYNRHYRLDMEALKIRYTSDKKFRKLACLSGLRESTFSISEIAHVRSGHATDTFNSLIKKTRGDAIPFVEGIKAEPEVCFSVIFTQKTRETLDLIAPTRQDRDTWVKCLNHIVVTINTLDRQKEYEL
ncbi:hypothetical protein TCAL_16377 [Tigriopus californicus]|uniref:PH domain-containing protein n=2 Tax=Tigriopus californicus TaxID=6832 RepID=A0A553NXC7_TIGCA|nr:hypothetical protein TCAL_16377 [Tigriopus californicus]